MHVICAGRLPRPIKVIDMRENLRDPEDGILRVGREQSFKCDLINMEHMQDFAKFSTFRKLPVCQFIKFANFRKLNQIPKFRKFQRIR